MQGITPCLWFDTQAEEAVRFYASVFDDFAVGDTTRYGPDEMGTAGAVRTVSFRAHGQDFLALNGGSMFQFTPAVSFILNCETQEEIDRLWERLTPDGAIMACGWLTDRFGVTWQVVPAALSAMVTDPDEKRAQRVIAALLPMVKIDLAALEKAYRGE